MMIVCAISLFLVLHVFVEAEALDLRRLAGISMESSNTILHFVQETPLFCGQWSVYEEINEFHKLREKNLGRRQQLANVIKYSN
jgi:hypothetical protein